MKLKKIKITSSFWNRYRNMVADKAVPFQWQMISDQKSPDITSDKAAGGKAEKSYAIKNLKIAAGQLNGQHHGMIFQDTDVYKWLETVAYVLNYDHDEQLKALADQVVDLIADAQDKDGYLSTRYQIDTPELKFKQLQQSHELYSMGHYIEAGIAYYQTTGNKKSLDIAKKMADCIDENFGLQSKKTHGYDGHPEIELALSKLYECTQDNRYLDLATYFVEIRGNRPDFFKQQNARNDIKLDPFPMMRDATDNYFFDEKPIDQVKMVQGHAVRVLYYLTGLTYIARLTNKKNLKDDAERLWQDITTKQMYVTGNVGQTAVGEAFTGDYDLPNRTDYGETCASVAMVMFAKQMEKIFDNGKYGDVIEKEIYNGALAGISLDGEHYFYANPLEIDKVSAFNPASSHLSNKRLSWFSCACCPANITRLIASLNKYIYTCNNKDILLDQFISNEAVFDHDISIKVESDFPWNGNVKIEIKNPKQENFMFKVRIPAWAEKYKSSIKSNLIENKILNFEINGDFVLDINFEMKIQLLHANPLIAADRGKVAIQRGPIIYCEEEADNQTDFCTYMLPANPDIKEEYKDSLLAGIVQITIKNVFFSSAKSLYWSNDSQIGENKDLVMVPYYSWANRKPGQMSVWINQGEK